MLGGLIDRACRGLHPAAAADVLLRAAGARLKLHLRVHPPSRNGRHPNGQDEEHSQTEQVGRS